MLLPLSKPGTIESLESIGQYVLEVATIAGLDKIIASRLQLMLLEIACNIITRGYLAAGLEGTLDLEANIDRQGLTIMLEDSALPYDSRPTLLPDLTAPLQQSGPAAISELSPIAELRYERVGSLNRTTLLVKIAQVSPISSSNPRPASA